MPNVVALAVGGFWGLLSCMALTYGILGIRTGVRIRRGSLPNERVIQRWRRQLAKQGVWRQETSEEERELIVRWVRSQADWQIVGGAGALAGLVVVAVIGALTRDLLFSSLYAVYPLIFLPWMFILLLATCMFYLPRAARTPAGAIADSLSHYRPRLVPVTIASIGIIYLALVALQAMNVLPRGEGISALNRLPADGYWLLWIAPLLTLSAVVVSESAIRNIVLMPPAPLSSVSALQTRANTALRRQQILGIEVAVTAIGEFCAFSEANLLPLKPDPYVVTFLPFILILAGIACMFVMVAWLAGWSGPHGGAVAAA